MDPAKNPSEPFVARQAAGTQTVHHTSPREQRARPKAKMAPPLTPMIDVTFQLLLFFILTMNFRVAEGQIPADLPVEDGNRDQSMAILAPIDVMLSRSTQAGTPKIQLTGHQLMVNSWAELHQLLRERKDKFTDEAPIVIRPDADVPWSDVMNAYNQAARAQFKSVAFGPAR